MKQSTKKLASKLRSRGEDKTEFGKFRMRDYLSTGCTLLNLAMTGKPFCGYKIGSYIHSVGDSHAGKTMLALTAMAEMANDPRFDGYDLVYDATTEDGAQMDVFRMFGSKLAKRIQVVRSNTAEEFYYNVEETVCRRPGIYICDSENGLDSDAAEDKFQKNKTAHEKGKEAAGSYGDGKARIHSQNVRRMCSKIKKMNSIVIMCSQSREKLNVMFGADPKTYSGGKALKFYAQIQMWLAVIKEVTKNVNGKERGIGSISEVRIKKNRYTGKKRRARIAIFDSVGIDDITSNINYMLEEGPWTKVGGGKIKAKGICNKPRKMDDLIHYIEQHNKERELALLVAEVWNDIEDQLKVTRKSRYQ